jgi:hypothetical protein
LLSACALIAPQAGAQDAASPRLRFPELSGYIEAVVADRYLYHGYVSDDHQPIVQPEFEIQGQFYSGKRWLTSASFVFTVFNSVQFYDQGLSTANQPLRSWYEAQFEPGISLVFAKDLTFTAKYVRLESPNGAFVSSNAIQLEIELDDARWLGSWALHPSFTWFAPVKIGTESGTEEGHYFELGLEPEYTMNENSKLPITIALPVALGFGDKHYYAGRHFGYFSIGFSATAGLAFIPKSFGSWSFGVSGTLYRLGRTSAELTNGGDEYETVVAATLRTEF